MSESLAVVLNEDVLYKPFRDGLLLLNLEDQRIFYMNSIASRIWSLLLKHGNPTGAVCDLLAEYEADETVLRHDVESLTKEFLHAQLLMKC